MSTADDHRSAADLELARLTAAVRSLKDVFASASPSAALAAGAAEDIERLVEQLAAVSAAEPAWTAERRWDRPARRQTFCPGFVIDARDDHSIAGRVSFSRFYLGGNGAAHGGALALFFDEMLGQLANVGGRKLARTASLTVEFRSVTLIGRELTFAGRFDREEGRKRFVSGELRDGGVLLAESSGLFIELKPGQP